MLEVLGVGPIGFPVSAEQARQLCELSRPALHGQGARTVLDRWVRYTWEVPKPLVRIDEQRFERTLGPALDQLGQELGLLPGDRLRAELHSMLVYSPGQFFVEHQDSEKSDEMVGTLVVGLPSSFRGGALQVRHRGEVRSYRGSSKSLSLVAFYGDCRHQAKPVTAGSTGSSSPTTCCSTATLHARSRSRTAGWSPSWRPAWTSTSPQHSNPVGSCACSTTSTRAVGLTARD